MERHHRRRAVRSIAMLVPALFAAACAGEGGSDPAQAVDLPPEPAATRYEVSIDGTSGIAPVSFHRFFPERLTAHPGDTVVFRRPDNGEPHTVTLATGPPRRDTVPGEKFFDGGFGNPPRVDASMPCFLDEGLPPAAGCTASQQQPIPFDGTQTWFNSGGLLGEEEFELALDDDITPGSYRFVCLIHTSTMQATIDVVPRTDPADDPDDVRARGQQAMVREQERAEVLADSPLTVVEGKVTAATTGPPFATWVNTFVPEDAEIPVGETVSWTIRGMHTISFNAPESARPFFVRAPDGSVQENPVAGPAGDPTAWDGSGLLNSGLVEGLFPAAHFDVTFTTPGTYAYRCLVHFDMEGKVVVRG